MILTYCAVLLTLFAPYAHAKEATGAAKGAAVKPVVHSLPLCIDDETEIAKIQAVMKSNSKNDFKYDGFKRALSGISDQELATRLVYSETLAGTCEEKNAQIAPLIAEVVGNRIRTRRGDIKSVVYQRDQFASSLNNYAESHLREFLCPKNATMWKQALAATKIGLESDKRQLPSDTVNYYLYKHSSRFTPPNWKLPEATVATAGKAELASCIRFFRNANWR